VSIKKAAGVTRNEILDAAWPLIGRKGVNVSMKEIAGASGVSRQSVYFHFKTHGGLLMALVERADQRFAIKEAFLAAMTSKSPVKRLDKSLSVWFDFVVKIQPVATHLIRLRKTDEDAAAAWSSRMEDLWLWQRELVRSLAADAALAKIWTINDATDFLWTSSSVQAWELFTSDRNWSAEKCSKMLRKTIARALLT